MFLFYLRRDLNYLCHVSVGKWCKLQIHVSNEKFSTQSVKITGVWQYLATLCVLSSFSYNYDTLWEDKCEMVIHHIVKFSQISGKPLTGLTWEFIEALIIGRHWTD